MRRERLAIGSIVRAVTVLAGALVALSGAPAQARTGLTARYTITVAGIRIGNGRWAVDIDRDRYAAQASGEFIGLWRALLGNDVSGDTRGIIRRGQLVPTSYEANFGWDDRIQLVQMALRDGTVTELDVKPEPYASSDRVPLTEAHLGGVIDPLTAGLVTAPPTGEVLSPKACQRTLPIFLGDHRFDLALSFKRFDDFQTETGYRGRTVVCAAIYRPIAGHEASDSRVKYLRQTPDTEVWLAPIGDTRVLGAIRILVPTLLGSAELKATRFEAVLEPR